MTEAGRYNPGDLRSARRLVEGTHFFDRPLVILSAPRSGSTLLYELLTRSRAVYSLGGESHGVIEELGGLDPMDGRVRSNRLTRDDADDETAVTLRTGFLLGARDADGVRYLDRSPAARPQTMRFVEKTPKNMLRVPFMREVFPGARFVLLVREPREALSSMIEAWESGKFITYASLPGFRGPWSMLLPDGYQSVTNQSVDVCAAYQWLSAMRVALEDLRALPADEVCVVSYDELITAPATTVRKIAAMADIDFEDVAHFAETNALPVSTHTLSKPKPDKWMRHAARMRPFLPELEALAREVSAWSRASAARR